MSEAPPGSSWERADSPGSSGEASARGARTLVWEWPLRIWHWLFALCIAGSLCTGLAGDIALMERHLTFGYWVLALVLFRLLWAVWGGRYARFASYATSPRRVLAYFSGTSPVAAHTPPGAALVLLLVLLVVLQVIAGLFTTDEIFTEGPLVRHAPEALVNFMSGAHHRIFWLILAAVGVHLAAHAVYGLRRDPTPLSMFTGRKALDIAPTEQRWLAAFMTAALVAGLVFLGLRVI